MQEWITSPGSLSSLANVSRRRGHILAQADNVLNMVAAISCALSFPSASLELRIAAYETNIRSLIMFWNVSF